MEVKEILCSIIPSMIHDNLDSILLFPLAMYSILCPERSGFLEFMDSTSIFPFYYSLSWDSRVFGIRGMDFERRIPPISGTSLNKLFREEEA